MRKLILILLFPLLVWGQSKPASSWEADFQAYLAGSGKSWRAAAIESTCGGDGYFEGFTDIFGYLRAMQASGNLNYLDKIFDNIERDMDAAVVTADFYATHNINAGSFYTPRLPQKSRIQLPNYYKANDIDINSYFKPPLSDYLSGNSFTGLSNTGFAYNYFEATGARGAYRTHVLDENIYFRYVAYMLKVLFKNPDILALTSGNGQTYQTRYNAALSYIITNVWEKWVETTASNTNINGHQYGFVYRGNTHMCSHLASIAASLYVITQESKYLDFAEAYLWDFSNPYDDFTSQYEIPGGVGLLDKFELQPDGSYFWAHLWERTVDNFQAQDISHAGPEVNFLIQCFEDGIGANPPPGNLAVDQNLINALVKTMTDHIINGDPTTSTSVSYFIDGNSPGWWNKNQMAQGLYDLAQYDTDILAFLENNILSSQMAIQTYGHAMYAARIHNIMGEGDPVYFSDGSSGGSGPTNTAPSVFLNGNQSVNISQGGIYDELGAQWNDQQDGSGTIPEPTTVLLNGAQVDSVNVNVVGTYTLDYRYTDTGGLNDTATRTVTVFLPGNNPPNIALIGSASIEHQRGTPFTDPGAQWTDTEDGSGTVFSDVVVDVNTDAIYTLPYVYQDAGGESAYASREVEVRDFASDVLATSITGETGPIVLDVGEIYRPQAVILPSNVSQPFYEVISNTPAVVSVNPNGDVTAESPGTALITYKTQDGTGLTDTVEYQVRVPATISVRFVPGTFFIIYVQ